LPDLLHDKRPHEDTTIIQVFKGFSGHTRIYLLVYTSYVTAVLVLPGVIAVSLVAQIVTYGEHA
jgi:hypothetical protein